MSSRFRLVSAVVLGAAILAVVSGCASGGPSDADQQELAKQWSPENVAKEYEKKGMMKEAAEVRRSAGGQGQQDSGRQ